MPPKAKGCLLVLFVSVVFMSLIIFMAYKTITFNSYHKKQLDFISSIEFKGRVFKVHVIEHVGNRVYVMCVKADYCNVTDIYVYNQYCALKIKDEIINMPGGTFNKNYIPDSVEVNWNKSGKEKFYYKNGTSDEFPLSLDSHGISESDLKICN